MTSDLIQAAVFAAAVGAVCVPLGFYMAWVFAGGAQFLRPVETALLRSAGIRAEDGQHWTRYALALIVFNAAGFAVLFLILRFQHLLPLNPQGFEGVPAHLAFNTAISFVTNTNWQSYGGETTLSHLSQMAGLTTQNFLSAASGMAVAAAVARGFAGRQARTIGNFWADLVRAVLYILLPLAIGLAVLLIWLGVPQTLAASVSASGLEGGQQTIALGPVASQIAI